MKAYKTVIVKILSFIIISMLIIGCGSDDDTAAATCSDGIKNGDETGVDCGGSCNACDVPFTCADGIKNGDETDVDCGGSCISCSATTSCTDGIKNGDETDVDCGGSCPPCSVPSTCTDGIQNGDETGVDCGGSCIDCSSTATCTDGVQNGDETGVDCGGSCPSCLIFSDDFNRANTASGDLGTNWEFPSDIAEGASVAIESNRVRFSQTEDDLDVTLALVKNQTLSGSTYSIKFDFSYTDQNNLESITLGILGKVNFETASGYAVIFEGNQLKLFKFEDNDSEELHEVAINLSANTNYSLEFNINGSTLTGHVRDTNGNIISTVNGSDNTFTSGSVGFIGKSGVANESLYLDNFEIK